MRGFSICHSPLKSLIHTHTHTTHRPVEITHTARKLYSELLPAFESLFSRKKNARFLDALALAVQGGKWKRLAEGMKSAVRSAREKLEGMEENDGRCVCVCMID